MTLEEIDQTLPNGFHDSSILAVHLNYELRTVELEMRLWFAGPDDTDPEVYRKATLFISELLYFVIEPPDQPYKSETDLSLVDGGSSELPKYTSQLPKPLPAGAFTYWFFVNNWNAFIHVAALSAEIKIHSVET